MPTSCWKATAARATPRRSGGRATCSCSPPRPPRRWRRAPNSSVPRWSRAATATISCRRSATPCWRDGTISAIAWRWWRRTWRRRATASSSIWPENSVPTCSPVRSIAHFPPRRPSPAISINCWTTAAAPEAVRSGSCCPDWPTATARGTTSTDAGCLPRSGMVPARRRRACPCRVIRSPASTTGPTSAAANNNPCRPRPRAWRICTRWCIAMYRPWQGRVLRAASAAARRSWPIIASVIGWCSPLPPTSNWRAKRSSGPANCRRGKSRCGTWRGCGHWPLPPAVATARSRCTANWPSTVTITIACRSGFTAWTTGRSSCTPRATRNWPPLPSRRRRPSICRRCVRVATSASAAMTRCTAISRAWARITVPHSVAPRTSASARTWWWASCRAKRRIPAWTAFCCRRACSTARSTSRRRWGRGLAGKAPPNRPCLLAWKACDCMGRWRRRSARAP